MRSILTLVALTACAPIQFEIDHEQIKPASYPVVDAIAIGLKFLDCEKVDIRVHDGREDPVPRGRNLSDLRARAVEAYLVRAGVPAAHLDAHGYGATQPLVPASTPNAAQINRRVEIVPIECRALGIVP